ncbi:Caspase [Scophthalmus maximus]|uniref:Caspase n=1 Tax=Scophthalmus maximus TaxID=52904 RepID=A0A2U9B4V4_SCOMX|nr:caspase a [Scophthalmus maximus]AWO98926.1 Caspase [Scophthalmus maximus]
MAADLAKVRSKFVDKVSKATLIQLLDDILEDCIVNDGEKDSILEEHNCRADKARSLFDIVKKKGDSASRKLIAHLQIRDPTLHSELGLSCGQPAPPAAELRGDQGGSTTLIPTTEDFWRAKRNDKNIYTVTKNNIRNRVALLITNIKFTDKSLNREGAERDEENMENLLTDLGYEVVKHTNLTAKAIDGALLTFSTHPKLKDTDSVLVVIMSHGKLGTILGVDGKDDKFHIDNIYKHLGSEKCPALLDKPKIIIIQACRGVHEGSVRVTTCATVDSDDDDMCVDEIKDDTLRRFAHREKDFISILSCTPDTVSYRHKGSGSFLIQYIVDIFNSVAREDDIEELFRKVMQRFESPLGEKRQMPVKDRCSLTKRFYFYPGLSTI